MSALQERVHDDVDDGDIGELTASILLVDDIPANLLALGAVLEPLGHRLVKARSGEEALKCLLKEDFALILMDVQMPHLDGFQTVALIKQRRKSVHVPIIFVTAIAKETEAIAKGYEYGAVDYITKPFEADILRAKVSVLVALHLQAERIVRQQALLFKRRQELQQKESERVIAESASRMKDQFLAAISHELRSPLNIIKGWTDLIVKGELDEARMRSALATIQRNVEVQRRLVDDLLDISRMVTGTLHLERDELSVVTLMRAAVDAQRPHAEQQGVELALESEQDERISADPTRMEQIFSNLLTNAIKFTPSGGRVVVRVGRSERGARIEIQDSGIGIASKDLPYVFDRFWQGDHAATHLTRQGLGLGLAIVRQLVELHGGTVHARSDGAGQGATFVVELPRVDGRDSLLAPVEAGSG